MRKIISNTTIAIIQNRQTKKLMMAGERRISMSDGSYIISPIPKVVNKDGVLLGATGDSYFCWLMTEGMKVPPRLINQTVSDYMMNDYFKSVEDLLITRNYLDPQGTYKLPTDLYCEVLIGIMQEVYVLFIYNTNNDARIEIHPWVHPYAIGCGGSAALSSLKTTEHSKLKDKDRLLLALGIAADMESGCDSNIDIIEE